jgi:acyl-CoA thioesterase FadM
MAGITADGRRMRLRNTFVREHDGAVAALVESVIMWFDLSTRRTTVPPEALRDIWLAVPRTDDFVALD